MSGFSSSRLSELKLYGNTQFDVTTTVVKGGQPFGKVDQITSGYTSYTINNVQYSGTVDTGGTTWTIPGVAGSDLAADTDFRVTATGTDNAGNPISVTGDSTHTVDTDAYKTLAADKIFEAEIATL